MIYHTIMVQLDIDAPATPRLAFAWNLARDFEAEMIAFAAAAPVVTTPADVETMRSQIEERLQALRAEFDDLTQDSNRASWRGAVGDPTRFLGLYARAADLLVVGPANSGKSRLRTIDPGELILSAGRPVLFASDSYRPMTAENILVAWKDTREARRAVVDSMPFLTGARNVLVASAEEHELTKTRESSADVVRFLMKHGVKARSQILDAGHASIAEALLQASVEIGADLIVSGGYAHNRLHEWAFGGVTRSLLQDNSINRLITH